MRPQLLAGNGEELGELVDVLGGGRGLAVEEGRDGDLAAAEVLRDGFEGEGLGGFGGEEGGGVGREAGDD